MKTSDVLWIAANEILAKDRKEATDTADCQRSDLREGAMTTNHTPTPADYIEQISSLIRENGRLTRERDELVAEMKALLAAAQKMWDRPALDDSRQIGQDTRALRDQAKSAHAALAKVEGNK